MRIGRGCDTVGLEFVFFLPNFVPHYCLRTGLPGRRVHSSSYCTTYLTSEGALSFSVFDCDDGVCRKATLLGVKTVSLSQYRRTTTRKKALHLLVCASTVSLYRSRSTMTRSAYTSPLPDLPSTQPSTHSASRRLRWNL